MLRKLLFIALLCSGFAAAQSPMQIPGRTPRDGGAINPNEPDTKSPKKHDSSSKDIAQKLQKALDNKNPAYKGSEIKTAVDDQTVTLTGSVIDSSQHEMALQMARAYAEGRNVIDKLVIQ